MSVKYVPVIWNRFKLVVDAVFLATAMAYLAVFFYLAPLVENPLSAYDDAIRAMVAYGSCAFVMLSFILMIGPLARLDPRFLPLLYNRRHFGVMTCALALLHANAVLSWYFSFSPQEPLVALFAANTSYGQMLGFPFEIFGIAALVILLIMAVTSHDFWLGFLTPPVWKGLHMLVYPAYGLLVLHIGLGALQGAHGFPLFVFVFGLVCAVCALHFLSARRHMREEKALAAAPRRIASGDVWICVGRADVLPTTRGKIVRLPDGERAAVFSYGGKISATSNICAHQNGPLGEGCVLNGAITCPWHGFQYQPHDGRAPAPFTEKIATFALKYEDGQVWLNAKPNPSGTPVAPLVMAELGERP